MYTFFHGWRRKAGVVTLVMAIALMAMWLRSYLFNDEVSFPCGQSTCFVSSIHARLSLGRQTPSHSSDRVKWRAFNLSRINVTDTQESCDLQICRRWGGFRHESGTLKYERSRIEIEQWTIPYWSIAVPLTLLSAYLIVWMPRKATNTDPVSSLNCCQQKHDE
ncbi:MAG: hypothetical protein JWP89_5366 [Schlesneria sp.]|nr:hypothetical protein [Schlesneria sp.]